MENHASHQEVLLTEEVAERLPQHGLRPLTHYRLSKIHREGVPL
jgi:hypothetical protein